MFLVVLGVSPQRFLEDLHGYILLLCLCLCNCLYVVIEIKFNSIYFTYKKRHPPRIHFRATDICIYYIYVNYFLKASITEADDTSTTKAFTYDTNTLNVVYLINKEL